MRSTQLATLSVLMLTSSISVSAAPNPAFANIGFAMDSDSCGDGFYIGCSVYAADECCTLPAGYEGKSAHFVFGSAAYAADKVGRAFGAAGCAATDLIGEKSGALDANWFCLAQPAQPVTSAHYQIANTAGTVRMARGTKECRSPDHVVFPGGARASIEGLAEREYKEILDLVVARSDAATVEAKLATMRK